MVPIESPFLPMLTKSKAKCKTRNKETIGHQFFSKITISLQLPSTHQFRESLCKTRHSPISTIYLTCCYINLDIGINVQCPQNKSSFFRCQRTQSIFSFQVRIYNFLFPPGVCISVTNDRTIRDWRGREIKLKIFKNC